MRERVFITGIGTISSFGVGHEPFAQQLLAGATAVAPIAAFDTSPCHSHRAAMLKDFDPAAFISPMKLRRVDDTGRLAVACAKLALDDAHFSREAGDGSPGDRPDLIGVALGTYTAGLDSTVAYLRGLVKDGPAGVPALLFSNTVQNAPASLCAIECTLRGPNVTFNQREASSLAAMMFAVNAIRAGRTAGMLAGGADRVDEMLFRVYDRFRVLSPRTSGGEEAARPFDRRRNGMVLGEAGVLLLLESEASATARGVRVYGEVLGCGAASSRTAVNGWPAEPSGLVRAMRQALGDASLAPADVHAVFASANGTTEMDAMEAAALRDVFGQRPVPVASIKGAIGESGAVGAAAVAAGLRTLASGQMPPTAGWAELDPACAVNVSAAPVATGGDVFLVNSVASGGTNYSLAVRVRIPC